jgi:hypothetical protein
MNDQTKQMLSKMIGGDRSDTGSIMNSYVTMQTEEDQHRINLP